MKNKLPSKLAEFGSISKLSIEELIVSYAFSEAVVETIREPLLVLDKDLYIKRVNSAFLRTFKVSREETVNQRVYNLGNNQWNIPSLKKLIEETLSKDASFKDFEVEHTFQTIGKKTMVLNGRRVVLEGYETQLILLAIEDVTERRLLEQQREAFIGSAGHELKTPLTSTKLLTHLLLKEELGPNARLYVQKIDNKINVLSKLVDDLMTMSQLGGDKMVMQNEKFRVRDCLEIIIDDLPSYSENHQIHNEGDLDIEVVADKKLIGQVMTNLVLNAIKYSPDETKVIVSTKKTKDTLTVSVKDFGMGVPKKDQEKIFKPFYRSDNKKKKLIPGYGLGLFLSSEIINAHDGSLKIRSNGKKGSVFSFSIPLKPKAAP